MEGRTTGRRRRDAFEAKFTQVQLIDEGVNHPRGVVVGDGTTLIEGITNFENPLKGHISFASSHPGKAPFETVQLSYGTQVLWPDHCVWGTQAAELSAALRAHMQDAGRVPWQAPATPR